MRGCFPTVGAKPSPLPLMRVLAVPSPHGFHSEVTPEGRKATRLESILLNGNNVCIVSGSLFCACPRWCFHLAASRAVWGEQLVPGGAPGTEEEDVRVAE